MVWLVMKGLMKETISDEKKKISTDFRLPAGVNMHWLMLHISLTYHDILHRKFKHVNESMIEC